MPAPLVTMGAKLMCPMGAAPATMIVPPSKMVLGENMPVATIMDNTVANLTTFGTCLSLANPATASLTAAALGVLTPGPCIPVVPAPWTPANPLTLVGGVPAINQTSTCVCAYGGTIMVTQAGPTKTLG
jgi:hypothetical protein